MCEQLLSSTLEGKLQVNVLLKWLTNGNLRDDNFKGIARYKCFQSDFITFFLNYIHEIQINSDKNAENIPKTSTPKRLEHVKPDNDVSPMPTVRRRSNLFGSPNETRIDFNKTSEFTPKILRTNVNESYASPLSPLYNRENFTVPKNVFPLHPSPKAGPNLCLGDFIIANSKGSSKKKVQRNLNENVDFNCDEMNTSNSKTRRINPTCLNQRKCNTANFRKNSNSFTFKNEGDEIVDHSNGQRSFLVEERIKIISRKSPGDNLPLLPVSKTMLTNKINEILPSPELVVFKQQLDILVVIYSFLLDHSFVLNLTSELYFLISLLLSKEYDDDGSPNNTINFSVIPVVDGRYQHNLPKVCFGTIHNRIYFASKVLERQIHVLQVLDRSILRLLAENRRFQLFSSHTFLMTLLKIHDHKVDRLTEAPEESFHTNVYFISDTDNRDNFPTDPSFHSFRKQRDLFYETLRIWENNHLQNEWNFAVALGGKIKALLNMHADPANLVHFSRLFKAQLLRNTCTNSNEDGVTETQLSFLSSIPNVNAEKLSRLKSRIVSKQSCSGINSPPTFTGYQEFYRNFLLVAANYPFNKHLTDALISEIIELNDTKFTSSDLDDCNAIVDSATQKSYLQCIKSLRILAKFLGFLESLPYKSDCVQLPEKVVSCQVCVRDKIHPNLNVKDFVKSSIENKNLTLTIPWVTKFLAMLDYVTLRLPYYEEVIHMLFEIYFTCSSYSGVNSVHNPKQAQSTFVVKFCLGWLFELPHFPHGLYYNWLSHTFGKSHKGTQGSHGKNVKVQRNSSKTMCLDELDVVDQNVLHACCPYLQEIKTILTNDASLSNSANASFKHITPLTAIESPTDMTNKRMQNQLEEAFFNGQPVSIRKTVEFISERVASVCVKEICNEIVPAYKKSAVLELREVLSPIGVPDADDSNRAMLATAKTSQFATSSLSNLRTEINDKLKVMMSARIFPAVDALLATDVLKQTKDVCVTIATRTCTERVQQWINSHVNAGIFTKDFDGEVRKLLLNATSRHAKAKATFSLPSFGKHLEHNPSALSGVKTVEYIRSFSWTVIERPAGITIDMATELIDSVSESIQQRCDLNECILVLINKMLVDLAVLLATYRPDVILDDTVIRKLLSVWRESSSSSSDLFRTLICPKNIMLLTQSSIPDESWSSFHQFVNTLLTENFLTCDTLEAQAVTVCKQISERAIRKYLFDCLRSIVADHSKTVGSQSNFKLLRQFLSDADSTVL